MKSDIEQFVYNYLTNFFEFSPGYLLEKATHDYIYQGIVPNDDFPRAWSTKKSFQQECDQALEYYFKFNEAAHL